MRAILLFDTATRWEGATMRNHVESVLEYPRPPRIAPSSRRVRVVVGDTTIADSTRAVRVLEMSHPPVWYIPPDDVRTDLLDNSTTRTVCEFKGTASFWTIHTDDRTIDDVAWSYEQPIPAFASLRGYFAFYPGRVDACYVDDERVTPEPGDYYGGWITSEITGPFTNAD
jgi:uncharacterized protein (DUF427 family)